MGPLIRTIALSATGALSLGPAPAVAQDAPFSLPAECTAFLTIQMRSCTVSHHFTCAGDPAGHQRRVDLDQNGMIYLGTIDAETQWVSSYHPLSDHYETLAPDPMDPASFARLISTGLDSYDFRTFSDQIGTTRYVGQDTLTGRRVTIDGVTLEETEYQITAFDPDGTEVWRSAGNEFISRDWRMFLSGTGTVVVGDEAFDNDDTPVEFIFPGEAGFLSSQPKHGCGIVVSRAENLPAAEESRHDHL